MENNDIRKFLEDMFKELAHGPTEHQQWLFDKIKEIADSAFPGNYEMKPGDLTPNGKHVK